MSEPGAMCPPPPPPPPPAEECSSTPPSPNHRSRSPSPSSTSTALEVVEEPTLKPSEVVQRGGSGELLINFILLYGMAVLDII